MEVIKLKDEFIKLGQALKAAGCVESGLEAKIVIVHKKDFFHPRRANHFTDCRTDFSAKPAWKGLPSPPGR